MEINYKTLSGFARTHGSIIILDTQGRARKLPGGETDVIDKADRFVFDCKWYARADFEALMEKAGCDASHS